MSDRLFSMDDVPEVPLIREARRSRGENDARFRNDYPPQWHRCQRCLGAPADVFGFCGECLNMGSLKARARFETGHRCERCKHPFVTKDDAPYLSRLFGEAVLPSPGRWSPCDEQCTHGSPTRFLSDQGEWVESSVTAKVIPAVGGEFGAGRVEAEWRVLTVHHLDGDKANCRWWNLAALCQRCHLEIQAKVVMERVYPHEHTEWFKPHAAGYYAFVYLGEELSRDQVTDRLAELLDLELNPTNGGRT